MGKMLIGTLAIRKAPSWGQNRPPGCLFSMDLAQFGANHPNSSAYIGSRPSAFEESASLDMGPWSHGAHGPMVPWGQWSHRANGPMEPIGPMGSHAGRELQMRRRPITFGGAPLPRITNECSVCLSFACVFVWSPGLTHRRIQTGIQRTTQTPMDKGQDRQGTGQALGKDASPNSPEAPNPLRTGLSALV